MYKNSMAAARLFEFLYKLVCYIGVGIGMGEGWRDFFKLFINCYILRTSWIRVELCFIILRYMYLLHTPSKLKKKNTTPPHSHPSPQKRGLEKLVFTREARLFTFRLLSGFICHIFIQKKKFF